jgi:hypothetical protein
VNTRVFSVFFLLRLVGSFGAKEAMICHGWALMGWGFSCYWLVAA